MRSDHLAVHVKFKLTAVKLNIDKADMIVIDWGEIRMSTKTNDAFNDKLHLSLMDETNLCNYNPTEGSDYTSFYQSQLQAGAKQQPHLNLKTKVGSNFSGIPFYQPSSIETTSSTRFKP